MNDTHMNSNEMTANSLTLNDLNGEYLQEFTKTYTETPCNITTDLLPCEVDMGEAIKVLIELEHLQDDYKVYMENEHTSMGVFHGKRIRLTKGNWHYYMVLTSYNGKLHLHFEDGHNFMNGTVFTGRSKDWYLDKCPMLKRLAQKMLRKKYRVYNSEEARLDTNYKYHVVSNTGKCVGCQTMNECEDVIEMALRGHCDL